MTSFPDPTSPSGDQAATGAPIMVFTDGACLGNPGPGGWAWAVVGGRSAAGSEVHTTNQRMEVMAVLEALGNLDGRVEVFSDSTYVVNCFRQRWWKGWQARGWRNSKGAPVANQDLWKPLIETVLARGPGQIGFNWVKGHAGDPMNELVDSMAFEAAQAVRSRPV